VNPWLRTTLVDLCEITSSKRIYAADYEAEGVPFYRGKEIIEKHKGNLEVSTELFISESKFLEIKRRFGSPRVDDLLLTSVGTLGVPYVVKAGEEFYFKDGNLTWFRNFRNLCSSFLFYWLLSPAGKGELKKCTIGSSQPALTIVLLKGMEILLPPLPVQRRIAGILSAYADLIENNTRRIAILEEMARSLYQEWFVRFRYPGHEGVPLADSALGPIPEGWKVRTLAAIARENRRSVSPKQVSENTPYVGLEHLPRRSIALAEWGLAKDVQSTKLSFHRGDILFGKIRPYFHKVVVTPTEGVCSSDAIVITALQPDYFGLVLGCVSSDEFVAHATQTSQGTKMPRANWDVLLKYPVALPPPALLAQFNTFVQDAVGLVENLVFQNRKLRGTRDLLLPKLISGELDVEHLDLQPSELTA